MPTVLTEMGGRVRRDCKKQQSLYKVSEIKKKKKVEII